jgi:peptidyl-tRNA hydrolase
VVGVGVGRSGSEDQVVMQVRDELSCPLGHATIKQRASEGWNGISYIV